MVDARAVHKERTGDVSLPLELGENLFCQIFSWYKANLGAAPLSDAACAVLRTWIADHVSPDRLADSLSQTAVRRCHFALLS